MNIYIIRFWIWHWDSIEDDHQSERGKRNQQSIPRGNVKDIFLQVKTNLRAEAPSLKTHYVSSPSSWEKFCSDKSVKNIVEESWEKWVYIYFNFWTGYCIWDKVNLSDFPIKFLRVLRLELRWFWTDRHIPHPKEHHKEPILLFPSNLLHQKIKNSKWRATIQKREK